MRFCLIHLDDELGDDLHEEVCVIVPGAERVATLVPLCALARFLPILHEATADLPAQQCPACAAPLPEPHRPEVDAR